MQFRTEVKIPKAPFSINHRHKVVSIGSCFAEQIGQKLTESKFDVETNPFGNLFHPIAIENAIGRIHSRVHYIANEIFEYNNLFFSWDHHSSFSNPSKVDCINNINQTIDKYNVFTRKADFFIITLATSWVYKIKSMDFIVANCHKFPQREFQKLLLTTNEIYDSLLKTVKYILDIAPNAKIIFTISPVRHIKDGIVENNLSKSRLINAVHHLVSQSNELFYFPSYELILDDLRDYRFYKEDMIHPNDLAIEYVWNKFQETWMDDKTTELNAQIHKMNLAMNHRAFNPKTVQHQTFLYNTAKEMKRLNEFLTEKNFDNEIKNLEEQIKNVD